MTIMDVPNSLDTLNILLYKVDGRNTRNGMKQKLLISAIEDEKMIWNDCR